MWPHRLFLRCGHPTDILGRFLGQIKHARNDVPRDTTSYMSVANEASPPTSVESLTSRSTTTFLPAKLFMSW